MSHSNLLKKWNENYSSVFGKTDCLCYVSIHPVAIKCSKLTIETPEQGVKYVQS